MTANNKRVCYEQQRIKTLSKNSDSYDFFNLLMINGVRLD